MASAASRHLAALALKVRCFGGNCDGLVSYCPPGSSQAGITQLAWRGLHSLRGTCPCFPVARRLHEGSLQCYSPGRCLDSAGSGNPQQLPRWSRVPGAPYRRARALTCNLEPEKPAPAAHDGTREAPNPRPRAAAPTRRTCQRSNVLTCSRANAVTREPVPRLARHPGDVAQGLPRPPFLLPHQR